MDRRAFLSKGASLGVATSVVLTEHGSAKRTDLVKADETDSDPGDALWLGTGNGYTIRDWLDRSWNIERYVPKSVMNRILAGEKMDATRYIQAALDDASRNGGGWLDFPKGVFFCNVIYRPFVIVRGTGAYETVFRPFADDHVFKGPVDGACVRFGWERCGVTGDSSHEARDCINMEPRHGFYDTVSIRHVRLTGAGRNGLRVIGISTLHTFVQHLFMYDLTAEENARESIYFQGVVIEMTLESSFVTNPLDRSGATPAMTFAYNPAEGGSYPGKLLCTNVAWANAHAHDAHAKDTEGRDNACGIEIGAVGTLTLINCSFEFCSPCIRTADFTFANGFNWHGGVIGIQRPVDDLIVLRHSNAVLVTGVKVIANAASFIRMVGSMAGIRNVVQFGNDFLDGVKAIVDEGTTFYQTITPPQSQVPFSLHDYGRDMIVVRRHPRDSAGRLADFRSGNGDTTRFVTGQRVTLAAFYGDTIRITGHGNLKTTGDVETVLTGRRTATFAWNSQAREWWEVAG